MFPSDGGDRATRGSPTITASACVRATGYDRAPRARESRRDDCLVVERMEGSAGNKKNPTQGMGRGYLKGPCLTLLVSRRSLRDGYRGRSPDLRIVLLTNAFPAVSWPVACPVGFRPRSQWRVREGFAPSSRQSHLYSESNNSFQGNIIWRSKCQVLCLVYTRIFCTDLNHFICNVEGVDLPGETERRHTGSHHSHGEGVRRRGSADDLIRLGEECRRNREA